MIYICLLLQTAEVTLRSVQCSSIEERRERRGEERIVTSTLTLALTPLLQHCIAVSRPTPALTEYLELNKNTTRNILSQKKYSQYYPILPCNLRLRSRILSKIDLFKAFTSLLDWPRRSKSICL